LSAEIKKSGSKKSFFIRQIFGIYLKAGRKRVILSTLYGSLFFLLLIGLSLIVYVHRYQTFNQFYSEEVNWLNDGQISVITNEERYTKRQFSNTTMEDMINEFSSLVESYIPGINFYNYSAAISAEVYIHTNNPDEPWLNQELMAVDIETYSNLNQCIIQGRMPEQANEILCFRSPQSYVNLYDVVALYSSMFNAYETENYTVVGLVDFSDPTILQALNISNDIFSWHIDNIQFSNFDNYYKNNVFILPYANLKSYMEKAVSYDGILTYLMDFNYDVSTLKIYKMSHIINNIPTSSNLINSQILDLKIILGIDFKLNIIEYSNFWMNEIAIILALNAPIFFIIGLLAVVIITIGTKELENIFRKLKLFGLSYNSIRKLIILENIFFSLTSGFIAYVIGNLISYFIIIKTISENASNFWLFLIDPLLLFNLFTFIGTFFFFSFFIQNNIAKKAVGTVSESYRHNRGKIRQLFSTNEFRLFAISIVFSVISLSLFLIYKYTSFIYVTNLIFVTFFWYIIAISAALLFAFIFLLITRLILLIWSTINKYLWKNRISSFSMGIKHLIMSKQKYQPIIFSLLSFGFLFAPILNMEQSINNHVLVDAEFNVGLTDLVIFDWLDPEDELDAVLDSIDEIANYTEVAVYKFTNSNLGKIYPNAFEINLLGIE